MESQGDEMICIIEQKQNTSKKKEKSEQQEFGLEDIQGMSVKSLQFNTDLSQNIDFGSTQPIQINQKLMKSQILQDESQIVEKESSKLKQKSDETNSDLKSEAAPTAMTA